MKDAATPTKAKPVGTGTPPRRRHTLWLGSSPRKSKTEIDEERIKKDEELLFEAIEDGDVELVRYKLFGSRTSSSPDKNNCHPLCQCDRCKKMTKSHPLTKSHVDTTTTNKHGHTVLHIAALHGVTDVVKLLLDHMVDPSIQTDRQHTPLHFACQYNHSEVVKLLLAADPDADIDITTDSDNTALHFCASNGHSSCAHLLMDAKADVNAVNNRGDTPLHNATKWGYLELVAMLLSAGADTHLKNHRDHTPLDDTQNPSIVALLTAVDQKHGVKHRIVDSIVSTEILLCDAPLAHAFLSGTYFQIGVLHEPGNTNKDTSWPFFEKEGQPFPLAMYYCHARKAWAIARKIGDEKPLAMAHGNVLHPVLLSAAWSLLGEDGTYSVNIDIDVLGKGVSTFAPIVDNTASRADLWLQNFQPSSPSLHTEPLAAASTGAAEERTCADFAAEGGDGGSGGFGVAQVGGATAVELGEDAVVTWARQYLATLKNMPSYTVLKAEALTLFDHAQWTAHKERIAELLMPSDKALTAALRSASLETGAPPGGVDSEPATFEETFDGNITGHAMGTEEMNVSLTSIDDEESLYAFPQRTPPRAMLNSSGLRG